MKPEADSAGRTGVERHRQQNLRARAQERERRGEHSDHFSRLAIDHQRPSDGGRGGAEASLPIPMRQDDAERLARRIVFVFEDSTEDRLHAQ